MFSMAVAALTGVMIVPLAVAQAPPGRIEPTGKAADARVQAGRTRFSKLPELPAVENLDDLIALSADGAGRLTAQIIALPPETPRGRVPVRDLPGAAFEVVTQGSFVAGNGLPAVAVAAVTRYDFDAAARSDDANWSTRLDATEGYIRITGQSVAARSVLLQNNGLLTFTHTRAGNLRSIQGRANSIRELQERFPKEFDEYVLPLLAKFSDLPFLRPGPAEVYRVFDQLTADDGTTRRVLDLLPKLAADDFATRDAASRSLAALGPAGVLAVLRLDEEQVGPFSVEQRNRLSSVVDAARRLPPDRFDAATARSEPRFLVDCLEDPDAAVRVAAKRELERVLGRPVDYDVNLPPEARRAAADVVRKSLPKPAPTAATRPAPES